MVRRRIRISSVWAFAALIFTVAVFTGCRQNDPGTGVTVDPVGWTATSPVSIHYNNTDTVSTRDIIFFIKPASDFYGRGRLVIDHISPDSMIYSDTVDMGLLPGLSRDGTVLIGRARLRTEGDYEFRITPQGTVKGIRAVGIRIDDN